MVRNDGAKLMKLGVGKGEKRREGVRELVPRRKCPELRWLLSHYCKVGVMNMPVSRG